MVTLLKEHNSKLQHSSQLLRVKIQESNNLLLTPMRNLHKISSNNLTLVYLIKGMQLNNNLNHNKKIKREVNLTHWLKFSLWTDKKESKHKHQSKHNNLINMFKIWNCKKIVLMKLTQSSWLSGAAIGQGLNPNCQEKSSQ